MNGKNVRLLFITLLLVLLVVGTVFATDSPPLLPDAFWGTISTLDNSAVNGSIIEGYIDSKLVGNLSFSGTPYGGSAGYDDKLIIQAPQSDLNKAISFYINGVLASPTDKYVSSQIKNLTLKIPYNLQNVTFNISSNSVYVGNLITYAVKARYTNNAEEDVTAKPQTHVNIADSSIFTLENGALKAKIAGTSKVTITFGNQSKEFTLTVTNGGSGGGGVTVPSEPTQPVFTSKINDIANNWAKDYIFKLEQKGIINGYTDGTFKPDNNITRGEFIKMLVLSAGLTPSNDFTVLKGFKDYGKMLDWVKPYAVAALKAKLMTGYLDKTLKLDEKINRNEIAVLVANALFGNEQAKLAFKDNAKIPAWSKGAIAKLTSYGLINGYPDGNFKPDQFVTRAEAAKILALFIDKK